VATTHELSCEASPAGLLFECLDGAAGASSSSGPPGKLTVIDRGDQFAQHRGSHSDLTFAEPTIYRP
jgi:hypothetical protein